MSIAPASCPTPESLEALALGHAAAAALEEHVANCESCRRALERIRENNRFLSRFAIDGALPAAPPRPMRLSEIEIPGYQIAREIHRGGQGVVYQAQQLSTRRDVAIKVMKHGPFATIADRARFAREIEILGRLEHPNIVAVHDAGEISGFHYFVMNYIDGLALDEAFSGEAWIKTAASSASAERDGSAAGSFVRRPAPRTRVVLTTFLKVCEAVHAAHLRGVMHRDLKPSNILVDASGEPYVLDFGLAKATDAERDSAMTRTGQFVGSLPWASPEQIAGDAGKIDLRTDVYSLGAILFQLLTGGPPFDAGSNLRDAMENVLRREPVRPSSLVGSGAGLERIDDELDTIVLKCLSKDRERRYEGAGDLARDVRRYLSGEPIEAKRDSALYVLRKTLRRYRRRVIAAGALGVLLLAVSAVMTVLYDRSVRMEQRAVQSAGSLAELLSTSNIEQGRMAGLLGNMQQAERLLWRELLVARTASGGATTLHAPPGPAEAYWALWDLYRRNPCVRTVTPTPTAARGLTPAADGNGLWSGAVDGTVARLDSFGAILWQQGGALPAKAGVPFLSADGLVAMTATSTNLAVFRRPSADSSVPFEKLMDSRNQPLRLSIGGRLILVIEGGAVLVWDAASLLEVRRFATTGHDWVAAAISDDERRLAARDRAGSICVWDVGSGAVVIQRDAPPSGAGSPPTPGFLCMSADGGMLADLWTIPARIWNLRESPPRFVEMAERAGDNRAQAFSPDGRVLAIGELGGALRLIDADTGQQMGLFIAHAGKVEAVGFSSDGKGVWTAADGQLRLWETTREAGVTVRRAASEHFFTVDATPDGGRMFAAGNSGVLRVAQRGDVSSGGAGEFTESPLSGAGAVAAVAVSSDGRLLAAGTYGGALYVWRIDDLSAPRRKIDHPSRVCYVRFSDDGRQLLSCCDDGVVRVWSDADFSQVRELRGCDERVPQAVFDHAGERVAAVTRDGKVLVWRSDDAKPEVWSGATGSPRRAVRFSRDDRELLTAGADRVVEVWDAKERRRTAALAGHGQEIYCLDISPDGRLIATGDSGGGVRLWDLEHRSALATLEGHVEAAMCVRFAADGGALLSASVDGTVREWDLAYYERHIAGQVDAQLRVLGIEPGDSRGGAWRNWAQSAMRGASQRDGAPLQSAATRAGSESE